MKKFNEYLEQFNDESIKTSVFFNQLKYAIDEIENFDQLSKEEVFNEMKKNISRNLGLG